jgi:putative ABC transport system permease protein
MKYLPLIWCGLGRKRVRSALTFLCIVVSFMLLGSLKGLTSGLDATIAGLSDARLRVQSRVNLTQPLPIAHAQRIAEVPGVQRVAYATSFAGFYQEPKNNVLSSALDLPGLLALYPEISLPPEQRAAALTTRTGAIVGEELAQRFGWKVGDRVPLQSRLWARKDGSRLWTFDIVGIYRVTTDAMPSNSFYISYDYVDSARATANGTVSQFLVGIESAAVADRVSHQIDGLFANSSDATTTQGEKAYMRARVGQIGDIGFFVNAIAGATLFLLFALTVNTMMQSVRERIPELAVMQTIGYGRAKLSALVTSEAVLLCVGAALVGLIVARVMFPVILGGLGLGRVPLPVSVVAAGVVTASLLAVVSVAPSLWCVHRVSVVSSLRRA